MLQFWGKFLGACTFLFSIIALQFLKVKCDQYKTKVTMLKRGLRMLLLVSSKLRSRFLFNVVVYGWGQCWIYINESEGIVGNITVNIRNDDCLLTINFSFSVFFHLYIFGMNIKSLRWRTKFLFLFLSSQFL